MSNDGTYDPTIDRRHNPAAAPGDLPEGMEIGEYRVVRKIGEGGMGAVYAAVQPLIGKRVAIKVIAPHIASNPDVVRRFIDEARAVNKIGHPNIVDIFSFGWLPDRRHYFAMEFLDGHSLHERFKRAPLGPAESRRVLRQICEALEAAHRQGIVHRDLKPDNIWIAEPQHGESFAKLLDFGIAKLMGEGDAKLRTQTGVIMGTPAYMSPEQCRGEGIDPRTDVYALGVILYEMFAHRLPFAGTSGFAELITHHLMTVPLPPSRFAPIPPALDRVILACLEKDPAQRPPSAEALGRALEAALPGGEAAPAVRPVVATERAVPAPSPESPPDTLAPARGRTSPDLTQLPARNRRPLLVLAGLGAAAVVAVGVAGTGRHGGRTVSHPPAAERNTAPDPPASPAPATGVAHVSIKDTGGAGGLGASISIDGKLIAAGVRETRVPNVAAGQPHRLRVEAPDRLPFERTFTVAAGAEVELEAELVSPPPVASPEPSRPALHPAPERAHRKEPPPASPRPSIGAPARHRDGLVGDDIFDAPRPR